MWILGVSTIAFVILLALMVAEALSPTQDPTESTNALIILSIPTCIAFVIIMAMIVELRTRRHIDYLENFEYQPADAERL
jgi:hypothetical protein